MMDGSTNVRAFGVDAQLEPRIGGFGNIPITQKAAPSIKLKCCKTTSTWSITMHELKSSHSQRIMFLHLAPSNL